jgi:hypothetical protein
MVRFRLFGIALVVMAALIVMVPGATVAAGYPSLGKGSMSPLITTVDDPANCVVTAPSFYNGVGLIIATFSGDPVFYGATGTLLLQGGKQYLLTAAHVVTQMGNILPDSFSVTFPGLAGTYTGIQYFIAPGWTGFQTDGYDLALVKLNSPVPTTAYDILRNEISGPVTGNIAGYGRYGTGDTGYIPNTFGTLHQGSNTFGEVLFPVPGNPYAFDFDDGSTARNTISNMGFPSDLGLGSEEVFVAFGDSGGPTFFGGLVAGVHSFSYTFGQPYDIDKDLNSSFGEIGVDTRVVIFAKWIDSVTGAPPPSNGGGETITDNFSGPAINRRLWKPYHYDQHQRLAQLGGELRILLYGASSGDPFGAGLYSNFILKGDFEISVDYRLIKWPSGNGVSIGFNNDKRFRAGEFVVRRISVPLNQSSEFKENYNAAFNAGSVPFPLYAYCLSSEKVTV